MTHRPIAFAAALACGMLFGPTQSTSAQEPAGQPSQVSTTREQVRTEFPYKEGTVILLSDLQERITRSRYRAQGHVQITYQDMLFTCDEAEYDLETREGRTTGTTRFSQGKQWLAASRAEFNLGLGTAVFYDATGFTDEEFLIRGRTIRKISKDTYAVETGFLTACQEKRPKWAFTLGHGRVRPEGTARLRHVIFRLKGVPVMYFPYIVWPLEKKQRSSGFMPFHMGKSTSKGRVFSEAYFQTLGKSADVTVYGEYFSLRGLGIGGVFRARPNERTRLFVQAYGINDRQNQGGAHLIVDGESRFGDGFRAVANVNITTNFEFRQAFADTFRSATIPLEKATAFLTRNSKAFSSNISLERQETFFPDRSLVIRKAPSFELLSLGHPLGKLPLVFFLKASADGVARTDQQVETPALVQRFDLHPSVAVRLPSIAGFSLIPTVGFRETYYSARLSKDPKPTVLAESLVRQYAEFELDLRTPTLERTFHASGTPGFRHVVEPVATYRRIAGIDRLGETLRFDAADAIADTNEVEYGIVNRLYRTRRTQSGNYDTSEFLSLGLAQKYYVDPTFGGAFRPGEPNSFYPLYSLTGFYTTSTARTLSPVSMILRVTPRRTVSYDIRVDYDQKYRRFRDESVSTYWQQDWLFLAGTYFRTHAVEPGLFESHQVQGQAAMGRLDRGLSGSVAMSYNIDTAKLLNSHTRLRYSWDCCGVSLEFQQYSLGLRVETRFSFSFSLKGIGNFGNLKRPESMF